MNEKEEQPQPEKEEKPIEEAPSELDILTKEMTTLQQSLKEHEEKYLLLLAESENSRKRLLKEREELMQFAIERVIVEFLQPIDHFETALRHAENATGDVKNWALGFEMILTQFKQVLSAHGITDYESVGKHFDPHLHEAMEVVETKDAKPGTILGQFVKGYKRGDRIIRVAKVKVAKAPTPPPPPEKSEEGKQDLNKQSEEKKP